MDVLQMMECMLAIQEEIECNQAKEEAHLERMEALLALRSWGEVTEACPEKSKAAVVIFEEGSDEIEATDLDANLEEMEAAMERQELRNDTMNWTISGHWRADLMLETWLFGIAKSRRSGAKGMVDFVRSWLSTADAVPTL
jgi:hypothetical protein